VDAVLGEKLPDAGHARRELGVRGGEVVVGADDVQRPDRQIRLDLALGDAFHRDESLGGPAAREPVAGEQSAERDADGNDRGAPGRAVDGHARGGSCSARSGWNNVATKNGCSSSSMPRTSPAMSNAVARSGPLVSSAANAGFSP